ncbi:MAG: ceramide glucosyltransferase [Pseudobdellovibrionaceae bacterium]
MIFWIIAIVGLVPLIAAVSGAIYTFKHFDKSPPHLDAIFGLHPVSVLKPIKGVDGYLEKNLESFFKIKYPSFEIIFCIAEKEDPAIHLVRRLQKKYPRVDTKLIIGDEKIGCNPKVNNLVKAYSQAKYDWLLISDSNVFVPTDYINRLVAHVESDTGIVTAVVAGRDFKSIGGELEAMYLNSFYARWMLVATALHEPVVVGKSMLFKRSVANRFGGIKSLARYLAEDYQAGRAMKQLGYKVVISRDPICQPIGDHSLKDFWRRHIRWGRIRKSQALTAFLIEPVMTPFISAFLVAVGLTRGFHFSFVAIFFLHVLIWAASDLLLYERLSTEYLKIRTIKIWCLRELLHLPLWLQTLCGSRVYWRGQYLKVKMGGILEQKERS